LTQADTYEKDELFATLDPLTRQVDLPEGGQILLTDTVGFIQDLPTKLIAAFRSTLEEVLEADLILHVVDASSEHYLNQMQTTNDVLDELGAGDIPQLEVYNKKDQLNRLFTGGKLLISALDPQDIERLIEEIERSISEILEYLEIRIPVDGFAHYNPAKEVMMNLKESFEEDGSVILKGYLRKDTRLYATLKQYEV